MLKNYYKINEDSTVETFLKDVNEKKNSRYIILEDENSYVDFRAIALRVKDVKEKLKSLKKPLSKCESENELEKLTHLIESGDLVIKTKNGLYDLEDSYQTILNEDYGFLKQTIEQTETRPEVFALNEEDKISSARSMFKEKRTNILPVIENMKLIGEIRTIDLLTTKLFQGGKQEKSSYHNENYASSVTNLPITNIMNTKPLTISKHKTLKEALKLMSDKKLPSLIVTEGENNKLYSIVSYKEIFKLIKQENKKDLYKLELVGTGKLYEDEKELIEIYSRRSMDKIQKLSNYDNLKLTFKTIGNTEGTHLRKVDLKILLSHGNHILTVEKEIQSSTIDEELNAHQKENWNIPKLTMEALKILEKQVMDEKKKQK